MNKQKGLAPILIILLIASAIGGYLIYSGKINLPQKQTTQIETSTDETANWKTYTNSKIDITFQYPNPFLENEIDTIKGNEEYRRRFPGTEEINYGSFFVSFNPPQASSEEKTNSNFNFKTYDSNNMFIYVQAFDDANATLEEFIKSYHDDKGIYRKTPKYEILKKNLKPSSIPTTGSYIYTEYSEDLKGNTQKSIYFSFKDKFYIFTLYPGGGYAPTYSPEVERIFDQIISSIKFI